MKTNLKQLSEEELTLFIERLGQKPYRARQIINWIYKRLTTSFDEMAELSKNLREELKKIAFINNLNLLKRQLSKVGTTHRGRFVPGFQNGTGKFLFELEDGETIESVLIPDKDRLTLCISSQAGCRMGCRFCGTGRLGLKRNLRAYEIVEQVIAVKRDAPFITNIVLMGMGEPLDNFNEVIHALWKITGLMGFSKRRVTLSTAGIIPKILELAEKGPGINLAISLNATTDELRNKIMPINKKYPLKELISTCKKFPLTPGRRITFEYVLFDGMNDSKKDALRLIKLLRGIRSKVNLIPYNSITMKQPARVSKQQKKFHEFRRPPEDQITAFQKILLKAGITAMIRKSKGADISAACGQLRASYSLTSTLYSS